MASILSSFQTSFFQLFRYGIVGLTSNGLGYSIFLLLTFLGVGVKQAMTLLYLTSTVISYWGNRSWTFKHRGKFLATSSRFILAHICGYLINLTLLLIFVDKLEYSYQWVQAIAIIIVALFIFITFKLFVFTSTNFRPHNEKMS